MKDCQWARIIHQKSPPQSVCSTEARGTQNRTRVNRESQVANSVIEAANRNRIVPVCQNALYEQMRARNMGICNGCVTN